MIIVEGPDGSGKSTLVAKMLNLFDGLERVPSAVASDATPLRPIGAYVNEELRKGFGLRLYDRFALISSPMYLCLPNPTFRDEMTDMIWLKDQHQRFRKIDPLIIFCMPPLEVVRANILADPSSEVMWPFIDQIYYSYLAYIAREENMSSMVWDYTDPTMHRLDALMRWARARVAKGRIHSSGR